MTNRPLVKRRTKDPRRSYLDAADNGGKPATRSQEVWLVRATALQHAISRKLRHLAPPEHRGEVLAGQTSPAEIAPRMTDNSAGSSPTSRAAGRDTDNIRVRIPALLSIEVATQP